MMSSRRRREVADRGASRPSGGQEAPFLPFPLRGWRNKARGQRCERARWRRSGADRRSCPLTEPVWEVESLLLPRLRACPGWATLRPVHLRRFVLPLSLATALALMIAAPASANHNWGRYHWARSSTVTPIDLVVDDSGVANSWRPSTVLSNWNTYGGPISLSSGKNGIDITTTSDSFGFTGWLGL